MSRNYCKVRTKVNENSGGGSKREKNAKKKVNILIKSSYNLILKYASLM